MPLSAVTGRTGWGRDRAQTSCATPSRGPAGGAVYGPASPIRPRHMPAGLFGKQNCGPGSPGVRSAYGLALPPDRRSRPGRAAEAGTTEIPVRRAAAPSRACRPRPARVGPVPRMALSRACRPVRAAGYRAADRPDTMRAAGQAGTVAGRSCPRGCTSAQVLRGWSRSNRGDRWDEVAHQRPLTLNRHRRSRSTKG